MLRFTFGCWTGAAAAAAVRGQPSRLEHCPQRSFLIMDTLPKPDALASKVLLSAKLVAEGSKPLLLGDASSQ